MKIIRTCSAPKFMISLPSWSNLAYDYRFRRKNLCLIKLSKDDNLGSFPRKNTSNKGFIKINLKKELKIGLSKKGPQNTASQRRP
ncbi:hypothetical protein BpHYR1_031235 [Brachionus plicatilis]|uniref:Uncharacterized protein n=1 Tax=Brachionus plicatilis TaxID=10195 RepID=A0A3M7QEN9_BRAPC|nr:hypothetical protein BpHYR1_031235 [Brachionus plicatilis]